ncbi:hypothetical protein [Paenibacillus sp. PL2-23]|uniref:hypothetical protein n=1 Tax=Paenibacillus sp. PL2-23 TaxID=2100729 RepID=UPI0030FD0416
MDDEFIKVENFEEILSLAKEMVSVGDYKLNFSLKVKYGIELVKTPQLLDVSTEAEAWQNPVQPTFLQINHGSYIGESGINHVIEELKIKQHSNRALVSLINQKDIMKSGDNPIPSFMILQFSQEGNELYVTAYFRALEVSKFLRINIEEARIIINQIYKEIPNITNVKLNIFAFRAYVKEQQTTLRKQEIDLMPERQLLILMQTNPKKMITLLKEKLHESTVIENGSLNLINEIINDSSARATLHKCFSGELLKDVLKKALASSQELMDLRRKTSHNPRINELNTEYLGYLNRFIEEVEKCLYQ